ncbi:MAG: TlyA family RNA methyltransferase [Desulfarculales bacterium]|jgi:23S rRNA (cytidine1920-2'-O)/16S rRNA (cytidine1409-2'-O)-methyltransferase|nr:TlyA family RNA methyltransferase [Desulfarculales bacterium]
MRLDHHLVEQNSIANHSQAQALILAGLVRVNGQVRTKAGFQVKPDMRVEIIQPLHPYVSRGGMKLAGALTSFGINPGGFFCLDVGASTGGFTDCLLQHGAAHVTSMDVGYGQLAYKLRQCPKVTVLERINARHLPDETAQGPFDLVVVDVSFISLTLIIPRLLSRLQDKGLLLCLVKPQFEAGKEKMEKGGVIRDEATRQDTLKKIRVFGQNMGLSYLDSCDSPIEGAKGNREFFLLLKK